MRIEGLSPSPQLLFPSTEEEVRDIVRASFQVSSSLEILGGGTKRGIGQPVEARNQLRTKALTGITLAEPEELVWSAKSGTPIEEIESELAAAGQVMPFEPPDWGPLLGSEPNRQTLGGVVATNLSGPRRVKVGAVRDFVLGVRAVDGRGQIFKCGGRVVKNVTGYDVSKLLTGSFGTLAVITEVTFKTLPAPETVSTLCWHGWSDEYAIQQLGKVLASPWEISAAAHFPSDVARKSSSTALTRVGSSVTAVRLEGFGPSMIYRARQVAALLGLPADNLDAIESRKLWREVADVGYFQGDNRIIWRLCVPPATAPTVVAAIQRSVPAQAYYDWGGGLIWLALDIAGPAAAVSVVRGALSSGQATLIRAPIALCQQISPFQPQASALKALNKRIRSALDPLYILNPGRLESK